MSPRATLRYPRASPGTPPVQKTDRCYWCGHRFHERGILCDEKHAVTGGPCRCRAKPLVD